MTAPVKMNPRTSGFIRTQKVKINGGNCKKQSFSVLFCSNGVCVITNVYMQSTHHAYTHTLHNRIAACGFDQRSGSRFLCVWTSFKKFPPSQKSSARVLRPKICCFFKNLAINYFTFTSFILRTNYRKSSKSLGLTPL